MIAAWLTVAAFAVLSIGSACDALEVGSPWAALIALFFGAVAAWLTWEIVADRRNFR